MTLTFLDIINLIPLFIIGTICSYTDIKKGKIFNKWIVLGFCLGFCFYLSLFLYNVFFIIQEVNSQYLLDIGRNTFIAFFVGYLLWNLKLWSAGDAKFFTLCSFLIPLKFYSKSYLPFFPSFNLLVNLFVPLLLIFSCIAIIRSIKSFFDQKNQLKIWKKENIKILFSLLISFFKSNAKSFLTYIFVFILIKKAQLLKNFISGIDFLFSPIFAFLLMFVVQGFIERKRKKYKWINYIIRATILLYFLDLIFYAKFSVLFSVLKNAFLLFVAVISFRQALYYYIDEQETKRIKINDLSEGTVISRKDLPMIRKRIERKKEAKIFGEIRAEGLTKEQARLIKNLFFGMKEEIRVYKTFPFAPLMFLSVILSLVIQTSFIDFLKNGL